MLGEIIRALFNVVFIPLDFILSNTFIAIELFFEIVFHVVLAPLAFVLGKVLDGINFLITIYIEFLILTFRLIGHVLENVLRAVGVVLEVVFEILQIVTRPLLVALRIAAEALGHVLQAVFHGIGVLLDATVAFLRFIVEPLDAILKAVAKFTTVIFKPLVNIMRLYAEVVARAVDFVFDRSVVAARIIGQGILNVARVVYEIASFVRYSAYNFAVRVINACKPIAMWILPPLDLRVTPKVVAVARFAYYYGFKPIITLPDLYTNYVNRPIANTIDRLSLALADRLQYRLPRNGRKIAFLLGEMLHVGLAATNFMAFISMNMGIGAALALATVPLATIRLVILAAIPITELHLLAATAMNFSIFSRKMQGHDITPTDYLVRNKPMRAFFEKLVEPAAELVLDNLAILAERVLPWRHAAGELRAAKLQLVRQAQQAAREAQAAAAQAELVTQQGNLTAAHAQHAAQQMAQATQHAQTAQQALQAVQAATTVELATAAAQQARAAAAEARTAAASAARDPQAAERARRVQRGATRAIRRGQGRAQQQAALQMMAHFAEVEDEDEEIIVNGFTAALDQAIAANDFRIVFNYLRQRGGLPGYGHLLNWSGDLKRQVANNKYTIRRFWGDLTLDERTCLEDLHPDWICVTSRELPRVPVYLIKGRAPGQTEGLRTYLNFTDLLAAIQTTVYDQSTHMDVVQNPETRERIPSLDSIHYDKNRHDEINAAVAKMRNYREIVNTAIATKNFQALLQDVRTQDSRELTATDTTFNILWHPKLEEQLQKQIRDEDGFWDEAIPATRRRAIEAARQDLICNITGKLMRYPVLLRAANGAVYNYDLLALLNLLRTNKVLPVRNGNPNRLTVTSLNQIIYPSPAQALINAMLQQELRPVLPADSDDEENPIGAISPPMLDSASSSPPRPPTP